MLTEPEIKAVGQTLALGAPQSGRPPAIGSAAAATLDLHQQQSLGLVEQQINLTPTAGPALFQHLPTGLQQQAQGPLFSPVPRALLRGSSHGRGPQSTT